MDHSKVINLLEMNVAFKEEKEIFCLGITQLSFRIQNEFGKK